MLTTLPPLAFFLILLATLTVGTMLGICLLGWWDSRRSHRGRRARWRFVWDEESTKRGAARVLTAACALIAQHYSPEWSELILSAGLLIIGLMGMFRTEREQ